MGEPSPCDSSCYGWYWVYWAYWAFGLWALALFPLYVPIPMLMKQFTRFFFVAVLLVASDLGSGSAHAQNEARLYTSLTGKTLRPYNSSTYSRPWILDTCTNPADPCSLTDLLNIGAWLSAPVVNDTIAVLVDGPGEVVEISGADVEPALHGQDAYLVFDRLNFQFYTNDGNPTVNEAGTLKFSGNLSD